jgi:hypothetical protein
VRVQNRLGKALRNIKIEKSLLLKVESLGEATNARDMGSLVVDIFDYLEKIEQCPEEFFYCITRLLSNHRLYGNKAFGEFLLRLSVSNFLFPNVHRSKIARIVEENYSSMEYDLKRMMLLEILHSYLSVDELTKSLLRMFYKEFAGLRPTAELIWELNALKMNGSISRVLTTQIKEAIELAFHKR